MDKSQLFMTFIGLTAMGIGGYYAGKRAEACRMNHALIGMMVTLLDYYEARSDLTKSSFLKYAERVVLTCAHAPMQRWAAVRTPAMKDELRKFMEGQYGKPETPPR